MKIINKRTMTEIKKIPLFSEFTETDIKTVLNITESKVCDFRKEEHISGEPEEEPLFGIPLSGKIFSVCANSEGNHTVLHIVYSGELFEISAFPPESRENYFWTAAEKSRLLLIKGNRLLPLCEKRPLLGRKFMYGFISALSCSNTEMLKKFSHASHHTLRKKILSYLSEQYQRTGSKTFTIRMNRHEMADYLGSNRSALSAELSKMKAEGLIDYQRNQFTISDDTVFDQFR